MMEGGEQWREGGNEGRGNLVIVHGGWLCPGALITRGWGIVHVHLREVLVVALIACCGLSMVVGVPMVWVFPWVVGVPVGGRCLHGGWVFAWGGCSLGWWHLCGGWVVGIHIVGGCLRSWWAFAWVGARCCPWVFVLHGRGTIVHG